MFSAITSILKIFILSIAPIVILLLKLFNFINTDWISIYIAWSSSIAALGVILFIMAGNSILEKHEQQQKETLLQHKKHEELFDILLGRVPKSLESRLSEITETQNKINTKIREISECTELLMKSKWHISRLYERYILLVKADVEKKEKDA